MLCCICNPSPYFPQRRQNIYSTSIHEFFTPYTSAKRDLDPYYKKNEEIVLKDNLYYVVKIYNISIITKELTRYIYKSNTLILRDCNSHTKVYK